MGEPRKSARVLGAEHGLNAQEMNFLLRNQGILEGAPRRWRPTPKGEKYAHQQHRSHGPNSSYEMPTWDDSIQDELDLSDDEKRQAREDAAQARADRRAEQVDTLDTDSSDVDGGVPERLAGAAAQAVVALGGAVVTFIWVTTVQPYLEKQWADRVAPRLRDLTNRDSSESDDSELDGTAKS